MVVQELADCACAAVADDVVRQVEHDDAGVIEQVTDEHAHLVVVHLATVEPEHPECLARSHALGQQQTVPGRELWRRGQNARYNWPHTIDCNISINNNDIILLLLY